MLRAFADAKIMTIEIMKENLVRATRKDCTSAHVSLFQSAPEFSISSKQQTNSSKSSLKTSNTSCLSTHLVLQFDLSLVRIFPSSVSCLDFSSTIRHFGELKEKQQILSAVSIMFQSQLMSST